MSEPFCTRAAKQDLTDILLYIAKDKPDAAFAWLEKIETKCPLIAATPEIGESKPQLGVGVRASVLGRYVIFGTVLLVWTSEIIWLLVARSLHLFE